LVRNRFKIPSISIGDPRFELRIQAAIEGQGFALADALVDGDIAEGRLVAPFNVMLSGYGYYLVHGTDTMRPIAQTFYNWLLAEAGEGPDNENYRKRSYPVGRVFERLS
jgi:DNA-binding transcriptional LysR family regulator